MLAKLWKQSYTWCIRYDKNNTIWLYLIYSVIACIYIDWIWFNPPSIIIFAANNNHIVLSLLAKLCKHTYTKVRCIFWEKQMNHGLLSKVNKLRQTYESLIIQLSIFPVHLALHLPIKIILKIKLFSVYFVAYWSNQCWNCFLILNLNCLCFSYL